MFPVMPPVVAQPQAAVSRDMAAAFAVDSQRPLRPARDAETARALRPADPTGEPTDMRLPTRRDKLVGPVPAFVRNMLQFLREKTMEPPRAVDPGLPEFDGAPPPAMPGEIVEIIEADLPEATQPDDTAQPARPVPSRPVVAQAVPESVTFYGGAAIAQQPAAGPAFDLKL